MPKFMSLCLPVSPKGPCIAPLVSYSDSILWEKITGWGKGQFKNGILECGGPRTLRHTSPFLAVYQHHTRCSQAETPSEVSLWGLPHSWAPRKSKWHQPSVQAVLWTSWDNSSHPHCMWSNPWGSKKSALRAPKYSSYNPTKLSYSAYTETFRCWWRS